MKRAPPTFVVEVRRQRRSANAIGKAGLAEPALAGSGRHAGAAAPFEAEPKAPLAAKPPLAAEAPPARPQGRILPSLADIEPITSRFEEAAASPRRKRDGLAATAKPKTRRKKDPGRHIAPSVLSFEETGTVAPRAVAERTAAAPSAGAQAKRKVAKVEPLATHAVAAAKPTAIPEAPLENAAADRAGARQARHRRILERYVLGAELKPGERWKRRLQKTW
jgi:hypothetical protein